MQKLGPDVSVVKSNGATDLSLLYTSVYVLTCEPWLARAIEVVAGVMTGPAIVTWWWIRNYVTVAVSELAIRSWMARKISLIFNN